jgi:hypothetical protein
MEQETATLRHPDGFATRSGDSCRSGTFMGANDLLGVAA